MNFMCWLNVFYKYTKMQFYCLDDQNNEVRWTWNVERMGEMRNEYKILVGKREEKSPLGRPRRRGKNSSRMNLRKIGWEVVN